MGILGLLAFVLIMLLSMIQSISNLISETKELKIYQVSILIALVVWLVNQLTTGDSLTYLQPVESVLFFYAVIGMIEGQRVARENANSPRMDRGWQSHSPVLP